MAKMQISFADSQRDDWSDVLDPDRLLWLRPETVKVAVSKKADGADGRWIAFLAIQGDRSAVAIEIEADLVIELGRVVQEVIAKERREILDGRDAAGARLENLELASEEE